MIKAGEELLRLQAEKQRLKEKIKQTREEIEQLKHKATDVEGYRWWNNAIENCLHELDKLIKESEG